MLLEELIARQRFTLNRTVRVERDPPGSGKSVAEAAGRLAETENFLADNTKVLAEILERLGKIQSEFLDQAENQMRASATSLLKPDLAKATVQERQALASLIKARDTIAKVLGKCKPGQGQQIRDFARTQMQKLRQPEEEDDEAQQLASRLRQLQKQEDAVNAAIGSLSASRQAAEGRQNSDDAEKPGRMDRKQIEELQQDVVYEAYDVEQIMRGTDDVTELARNRMGQATKQAEQASGAMARGDTQQASEASAEAGAMFGELARHLEGLLAGEPAARIAGARDLAGELARGERELGESLPSSGQSGPSSQSSPEKSQDGAEGNSGKGSQGTRGKGTRGSGGSGKGGEPDLPGRAGRLADGGRTLEDLLEALADLDDQAREETIEQLGRLLGESELAATVQRMEALQRQLRAGRQGGARAEARQMSQQLQTLSERLDTLHRSVVAPRLEALMALEKRAAALREQLGKLNSEAEISQWHREADLLMQDLGEQSIGQRAAGDLLDAMREEGWQDVGFGGWGWGRNAGAGYYGRPAVYDGSLETIVVELQQRAGELLLSDLIAAGDEPVPPEYETLVERYFQVLADVSRER